MEIQNIALYGTGLILGAPLVGLSLLALVRIANGMGLSSIFGTKSSTKIATE